MIEVRRISDWNKASIYREAWNEIVAIGAGGDGAVPSVFQTFEWNQLWWKSFGDTDHELLLLCAFDSAFEGEKLVGIAPLMIGRRILPMPSKVLRLIGVSNFASDYCSFIVNPDRKDVLNAFWDWLDAHPENWDEIEFTNIPEKCADIAVIEKRFKGRSKEYYICDAPTRILGDPESDKELVNRKSLKRHYNWFKNQGTLTYRHWESAAEIHARLDGFFEQHIGRRSITEDESQFKNENQRKFYRDLIDTMVPLGWIRFFTVELDGVAFAHHFGFEYAGKYYWYKPCFDINHIKKSPGEVLLKTLFEYSIEKKLKEFDFTAGSEAFKYRFANHIRKLYQIRAFRSPLHYSVFRIETLTRDVASMILRPFRKRPQNESDS